jgi:hypothetical protein
LRRGRAIAILPNDGTVYLNRVTGELNHMTDEEAQLLDEDTDMEYLPDWQKQALDEGRKVLDSEDWLPLPRRKAIPLPTAAPPPHTR